MIDALKDYANLPMVASVSVGTPMPSNRDIVDDSYDIALTMEFASESDLDAYNQDLSHKKVIKEKIRPYAEKAIIYDYYVIP